MKKKNLVALLSLLCVSTAAAGFAACGGGSGNGNNNADNNLNPPPTGYGKDFTAATVFQLSYQRAGLVTLGDGGETVYTYVEGFPLSFNTEDDESTTRIDETAQLSSDSVIGDETTVYSLEQQVYAYGATYFSFNPYVNPTTLSTDDEASKTKNDQRVTAAKLGAAGVYEFTVTVVGNSSATLTMQQFTWSQSGNAADESGLPVMINYSTGSGEAQGVTYSGTNQITCEWNSTESASEKYFVVTTTADCTFQVTVKRTGDAREPEYRYYTKEVTASSAENFSDEQSGTLTDMPANGVLKTVKGNDGYYHVMTADGPLLLINLTVASPDRVSQTAISAMGDDEYAVAPYRGISRETEPGSYIYESYDYSDVIAFYSAKVNKDGVYPVNDDLWSYLQDCSHKYLGAKPENLALSYLLACKYYLPEEGLPTEGSGTQSDPYVLYESATVSATFPANRTFFTFTPSTSGYYSITSTASNTVVSGVSSQSAYGKPYVKLEAGNAYTLTANGTIGANYSLKLDPVTKIRATESTSIAGTEDNPIITDNSTGTDADHPLTVSFTNVWEAQMNPDWGEDGIYVRWSTPLLMEGLYEFKVYGSLASLVYGDKTYYSGDTLYINAERGQTYEMLLTTNAYTGEGKIPTTSYLFSIMQCQDTVSLDSSEGVSFNLGAYGAQAYIVSDDVAEGEYVISPFAFSSDDTREVSLVYLSINGGEPIVLDRTNFVFMTTIKGGDVLMFTADEYATSCSLKLMTPIPAGTYSVTVACDSAVTFFFYAAEDATYTLTCSDVENANVRYGMVNSTGGTAQEDADGESDSADYGFIGTTIDDNTMVNENGETVPLSYSSVQLPVTSAGTLYEITCSPSRVYQLSENSSEPLTFTFTLTKDGE